MIYKDIKRKKIIVIIVIIAVFTALIFQLCKSTKIKSKELLDMINQNKSITLEIAKPSYDVEIEGTKERDMEWVQLDQLKTFNKGFRQDFDDIFNINIITHNKVNGKSGCLYG